MAKKILSIDDEPAVLKCIEKALRSKHYEIVTVSDPYKGLEMLKGKHSFDLLLLDVKMPGKSGFDIYREIGKICNIPVLFVTAYPDVFNAESKTFEEMWRNQFAAGLTDIIYKPFDLDTFFEKVEGLIGKAKKQKRK
jgi:CheY-like chemotaxis protein